MDWKILKDTAQVTELIEKSYVKTQAIFKHSTRCYISRSVLSRLEEDWEDNLHAETYFLDLLTYRDLSNLVAERFSVRHESPQLILIKDGKAIYNASHDNIELPSFRLLLN